jgi:hypothetical protein
MCAGKSKNYIVDSNSWLELKNANAARIAFSATTLLAGIMAFFEEGQG